MDTLLPLNFYLVIQAYLATIGIFGIVTVVDFWMVLLILKIAVVFLCAKTVFLNTALDLKNLEVTSKLVRGLHSGDQQMIFDFCSSSKTGVSAREIEHARPDDDSELQPKRQENEGNVLRPAERVRRCPLDVDHDRRCLQNFSRADLGVFHRCDRLQIRPTYK